MSLVYFALFTFILDYRSTTFTASMTFFSRMSRAAIQHRSPPYPCIQKHNRYPQRIFSRRQPLGFMAGGSGLALAMSIKC